MRKALKIKIALQLARGAGGDNDESAAPGQVPLQQWLSQVREFRTRR
jgi:hypothetical protein